MPSVATCRYSSYGTTRCGKFDWTLCAKTTSARPVSSTQFAWLSGERGSHSAILCGRNAVQLSFPDRTRLSLDALAATTAGPRTSHAQSVPAPTQVDPYQITVFPDGRAIIQGTEEIAEAKTLYARYIGT